MQNHYQPTDPGIVWRKDSQVAIGILPEGTEHRVLTPNVVTRPDGTYRMYFCGGSPESKERGILGYIVSAVSSDGTRWHKEEGIRVDIHSPDAEKWLLSPDVIVLPDGTLRMYFQARSAEGRDTILSALSADGLLWSREPGIRFEGPNASYGSPRCLPLNGGGYRLYFHEYPQPFRTGIEAKNCIISATSEDGRIFVRDSGVRIAQTTEWESFSVYGAEVLRLGDGSYRMYYAGWAAAPARGRIFGARSTDGLAWHKDRSILVDCEGPHQEVKVSEPAVVRLPDGRFRMFYEANDMKSDWRILSATTP